MNSAITIVIAIAIVIVIIFNIAILNVIDTAVIVINIGIVIVSVIYIAIVSFNVIRCGKRLHHQGLSAAARGMASQYLATRLIFQKCKAGLDLD